QGRDDFAFDDAGVAAALTDVHRLWRGESKAFLTGWEAGGHTVWALTFRHPERWRGGAPGSTNYQRPGGGSTGSSRASERARLPLQVFYAGAPTGAAVEGMEFFQQQTAVALGDARAHGFKPSPPRAIAGADHGPLATAVVAWCDSLRGGPRSK